MMGLSTQVFWILSPADMLIAVAWRELPFLSDGQDVEEACDFEDFFDVVTYVSDDHFTLFVHFFLGCEEDS